MAIKVYKEWKLSRGEDGKFMPEHKTLRKAHTTIDEWLAEEYNKNTYSSGLVYELDEEKTKELETDVNKRMAEKIRKGNKVSFTPQAEAVKPPEPPTPPALTPEQIKYNKRKEKMLTSGWVFDSAKNIFAKGENIIAAEELPGMNNIKFGKILK